MITRSQVKAITKLRPRLERYEKVATITLDEKEFAVLCTAALKARYTHINKKADTDPLYECSMDYLEEIEL